MKNSIQLRIITTPEEWITIQHSWNDVLNHSMSNSVFLTFEWLFSWYEQFVSTSTANLFIILVYENDKLIGFLPLFQNRHCNGLFYSKTLSFLGTPDAGSDYLDIVSLKNKEKIVTQCFIDFIFNDGTKEWDRIVFSDIPSNSLCLHYISRFLEDKYYILNFSSLCPVLDLPLNVDIFMANLSKSTLNRNFKKFVLMLQEDSHLNFFRYSYNDLHEGLNLFFDLYESNGTWPLAGQKDFIYHYAKTFNQNTLKVDLLKYDNKCIAGALLLSHNHTISGYLKAVDKTFYPNMSLGHNFIGLSIIRSIEDKFQCYDFSKGDEFYKFHWTNRYNKSNSFIFYNKSFIGHILSTKHIFKNFLKSIIR
jgi:hypothetical protein